MSISLPHDFPSSPLGSYAAIDSEYFPESGFTLVCQSISTVHPSVHGIEKQAIHYSMLIQGS